MIRLASSLDVRRKGESAVKLLEIKMTGTPRMEHFSTLKKITALLTKSHGYLLSFAPKTEKISEKVESIPWAEILKEYK